MRYNRGEWNRPLDTSNWIRTAILENGDEVNYHTCAQIKDNPDPLLVYDMDKWVYIGIGIIHTIQGVKQSDSEPCYLYQRR